MPIFMCFLIGEISYEEALQSPVGEWGSFHGVWFTWTAALRFG